MRKWFSLIAFCLSNFLSAYPIQDRKIDPEALSRLTGALGIPQGADILFETQKHWLRKAGLERWEMAEISSEKKQFVLDWAKEQGLFAPWKPLHKTYDKALILGATTSRMQGRLDYLTQLWKEGVRFEEIVWLTGQRPLDSRVDGLTDRCNTESESAHIIWNESDLPEGMRNLSIQFVEVPMKGDGRRPNTEDTIVAWLERVSPPCTALFVSDQPFCGYQFAVIKTALPRFVLFDLVGPGEVNVNHPAAAAITLDSIARWLYQDNIAHKLGK